ncbi:hypothetical protein BDZ89DRAFT_1128731 [Hymenopellis radicata]|nr:hypothetical protein BDZ89DRAFT_1128731 [Hymenopellis radicata]
MYNNVPYARNPSTIYNAPAANMTSHPGPNSLGLSAPMAARSPQPPYGHAHQSQAQVPLHVGSRSTTPQSSAVPQFPQSSPSGSRKSTRDKDRSLLLDASYGVNKSMDRVVAARLLIPTKNGTCYSGERDSRDLPLRGRDVAVYDTPVERRPVGKQYFLGQSSFKSALPTPKFSEAICRVGFTSKDRSDRALSGVSMGRIMGDEHAVRHGDLRPPELYDTDNIRVVFHLNGYEPRLMLIPTKCSNHDCLDLGGLAYAITAGYKACIEQAVMDISPLRTSPNIPMTMGVKNLRLVSLYCTENDRLTWWPELHVANVQY